MLVRRALLVVAACTFAVGCGRLLSKVHPDDAGASADAAATASAAASAVPVPSSASASSATAPASAVATTTMTSPSASASAAKATTKCAAGESLVEFDSGKRACATGCVDPSCNCQRG